MSHSADPETNAGLPYFETAREARGRACAPPQSLKPLKEKKPCAVPWDFFALMH